MPNTVQFPQTTVTLTVIVSDVGGLTSTPTTFTVTVRPFTDALQPFETTVNASQVWFLDFSRDLESYTTSATVGGFDVNVVNGSNGTSDFEDLLRVIGLTSATPIGNVQSGMDSNEVVVDRLKNNLIAELAAANAVSDEARQRAEDANMAKSRFLATMSHELRTPLNAILGFSEVMANEIMGPLKNDTYKEYTQNIHSSGAHLLNLINEILDLSRIEAGKYELHEQSMQVCDTLDDCYRLMRLRAENKGIDLIEEYTADLPAIWADERAIRQICLNLITNAIKFTPRGGEVVISARFANNGDQIISVRDTGPGIPEKEIPKVLSAFGQGSLAHKTAEGGTGLGLPIVTKLIELHGGKFELKSKLRHGTEAIVIIPAKRVMQPLPPLQPLDETPDRPRITFAKARPKPRHAAQTGKPREPAVRRPRPPRLLSPARPGQPTIAHA